MTEACGPAKKVTAPTTSAGIMSRLNARLPTEKIFVNTVAKCEPRRNAIDQIPIVPPSFLPIRFVRRDARISHLPHPSGLVCQHGGHAWRLHLAQASPSRRR